ncbi:MAG TPA: acyltransferase [Elusimicrobiota bacterium]|jgi:peptidoglycan/LPS O-acetylase OafA/YrhL|nr:acyltransferase [Elusimicrobiota bacterium]
MTRSLTQTLANVYESPSGSTRIVPMEGVRGLAVILVFFVHYHALFHRWALEGGLTFRISSFMWSIGHSGVDLFFALSGFLIYGSVITGRTPYLKFMGRRAWRIYPTFLAVFAVYLVLSRLFPGENKIPAGLLPGSSYIVQNLLLLPGLFDIPPMISVAWSLSYEFFYYLLIPLIVIGLGMRKWSSKECALLFAVMAAAYTAYCVHGPYPRLQLIMFVSGILLFEAFRLFPDEAVKSSTWSQDLLGLLALLACAPVAHMAGELGSGWFIKIVVQFHLFLVFLFACFRSNSFLGRMFSGRFIRYLGNMSYSYYLVHGLTLKFVAMLLARFAPMDTSGAIFWLALPAAFAATWVSSTLLYVIVEKRAQGRPRRHDLLLKTAVAPQPANTL